jgi:hypothetical protein
MAKRSRAGDRDERQFDLFTMAPGAVPPQLPTLPKPTPATTRPAKPRPVADAAPAIFAMATAQPRKKAGASRRSTPLPPLRLAERVASAWHNHHGGSDIAIPVGVVAALALVRQRDPDGADLADQLLALDPGQLLDVLREIWTCQWFAHPYLMEIARPLHEWLNSEHDPEPHVVKGVQAVAHAALNAGQLAITGDADPALRCQADLLGPVLTEFRSKSAREGLGAFYTPGPVADMMARMLFTPETLQPGQWISDPAAGTGGMLRAVALMMREHDANPHDFGWSMGDIDATAAACAAVNALVWDLGPNVLIDVGNSLAPDAGVERAFEHRKAVMAHHEHVMSLVSMAAAVHRARAFLSQLDKASA